MMTISTTDGFSAHYSEQLQYNWVDFYSQIRSRNFDTGWLLCHISVDSFQITKRLSYNDCSTYMPSFIQFLPVVYPVGVTDL